MITELVRKEKLTYWKELWRQRASSMKPNRIDGTALNGYFREKYAPTQFWDKRFEEVVKFNLSERYGNEAADSSDIVCYSVESDVLVGIDLNTGFFHVESEDIEKCIPIYDDLFVKRGLDDEDLQNYVLTGQYIELSDK